MQDMSDKSDTSYSNLVGVLTTKHGIVMEPTLAKGTFNCVAVATRKEHKYALKIVDTRSLSDYVKHFLPREFELVKAANQQNIVKVDEYLEPKEMVHRDIKCENVFLDKYDNIILGDFGFARNLRKGEIAKTFCGSRAFVAPEILRAISYEGNKTDIWSAGIVLFVMVTGVMPYDDRQPKKMLEKQLQHKIQ